MSKLGTILIIDDDYELALMLDRVLSHNNYESLVAHSATEMAALLADEQLHDAWPVSLILLDLMMPQTDGGTLYNWLRAHPKTAHTPIIILSALGSVDKRVELLNKGADDYIVKPCPIEELLARVAIHIKLADLRQRKQATEKQLSHQQNYWRAVLNIARGTTGLWELDALLNKIVETTAGQMNTSRCLLYLQDPEKGEVALAAQYPSEQILPGAYIPFLKQMLLHQQVHVSQKMMGVPLKRGEQLVGLLVLEFVVLPAEVRSLRSALEMLGVQLATAVVNAYLMAEIERQQAVKPALPAGDVVLNTAVSPVLPPTHDQLQTIYSYLQLLQQFEMSPAEQADYLNRIGLGLEALMQTNQT